MTEQILARTPSAAERKLAETVIDFYGGPLLYARVDLLPTSSGPVVTEVELTEPSLFLAFSEGATMRLARAIARRAR